jgi:hypothetical protein
MIQNSGWSPRFHGPSTRGVFKRSTVRVSAGEPASLDLSGTTGGPAAQTLTSGLPRRFNDGAPYFGECKPP